MKTIQTKREKLGIISFSMLKALFMLLAFCWINIVDAQLAINEDDSSGDPNAELDVKSTTKGIVFPVMTETERNAIPSPADGLLIFNRTGGYHNFYNGSTWMQINRDIVVPATNPTLGTGTDIGIGIGVSDPDNSAMLHINSTTKGFLLPRTNNTAIAATGMIYYRTGPKIILYYNGTDWLTILSATSNAGAGGSATAAGFLVGTGTIDQSAKMEVKTTSNKGMLIPRMTDAQRDAIDTPIEGLTLYNLTTNEIQYYMAGTWYRWSNANYSFGLVSSNPGLSCKDIYDNNPSTINVNASYYYIDPDGVGGNPAYQCTCDMTSDGGGWTLVENTGPKNTNNRVTTSSGVSNIPATVGSPFAKLSDADINLIRGVYNTSIMRVERPNGAFSGNVIYFKQNRIFNSTAANNASSIITYYTSYANALSNTSIQTGTSTYGSAFDSWSGGTLGYRIILSFGGEGAISDGATNTCGGTAANTRSECNTLVWVKQP